MEGEAVLKGEAAAADEGWNGGDGEGSRCRRFTRRAGPGGGADNALEGSFFGTAVASSCVRRRGVTWGDGNGRGWRELALREMTASPAVESGAARKAGAG